MDKKINKYLKEITIVLSLTFLLVAGISFAQMTWQTRWYQPKNWIQPGKVISSKQLAESLNYLYNKVQNGMSVSFGKQTLANKVGDMGKVINYTQCPKGYVMVGIKVSSGYSGGFVGRYIISGVQPICQEIGQGLKYTTTYTWKPGLPAGCSTTPPVNYSSCGVVTSSTRTANPYCVNGIGATVSSNLCNSATKPPTTVTCYNIDYSGCGP